MYRICQLNGQIRSGSLILKQICAAIITGLVLTGAAWAQTAITYTVQEDIDDVLFTVESEIIGRGLKIDTVNHVGEMLERTGADIGATKQIFIDAQIMSFCSAVISRKVMEVNPANLSFCPYKIFIYATPDKPDMTTVGHDAFLEGEMQMVQDLLDAIVKDALGLD
jgi:uncharacterized protein (DUF302 family)